MVSAHSVQSTCHRLTLSLCTEPGTFLNTFPRVTRPAQRLKVLIVQRSSTHPDRNNVVHNLSLTKLPAFPALHTERMLDKEVLTFLLPLVRMIELAARPRPHIRVVLFLHELLVLGAIPLVRQLRTTGISTWFLWFVWHDTLLKKKNHAFVRHGSVVLILLLQNG